MTILKNKTLSNNAKLFIGIIIGLIVLGVVLHLLGVNIKVD